MPRPAVAATDIPAKSIAVLPFENLSTDKGNAYFADGMQDLILTNLNELWELGYLSAQLGQRKQAIAQVALANRRDAAKKQFDPFQEECEDKDDMAQFQVALGNADEAVEALDWLLARPAGNFESVPLLKIDPTWDPTRKDPRFQALLKKYAIAQPAASGTSATSTTQ